MIKIEDEIFLSFVLENFLCNFFFQMKANSLKKAALIALYAVASICFTQFTDLRRFLVRLTDRVILPPFAATSVGHFGEHHAQRI